MIKDFAGHITKLTLLISICLVSMPPAFAVDKTIDQASVNVDAKNDKNDKNEKKDESSITLGEFAAYAEHELKTKVVTGYLTENKIHASLHKESLSYGHFLTQLDLNGYTAYKSKDYIVIIANRDARSAHIPIVEKNGSYYDDEYVTDTLKVEKACVTKVLAAVRPLVPQYGHMTSYEDAHLLIIVDTYSNVQRIKAIIKSIEANLNGPEDCDSNKK